MVLTNLVTIIEYKYELGLDLDFSRACRTSVPCPGLLSHSFDELLIQLLPPILWECMFGQPSIQCSQLPPSPNRLPSLTLPCPIPTSHNRNVRQLQGCRFESKTVGFGLSKLYAVNVEPFGTLGTVTLRVDRWTVHLLACTC